MILIILLLFTIIFLLILREKIFRKTDRNVEEFLKKNKTTLEIEMQKYIDSQNSNIKIVKALPIYEFKYNNNEHTCIIIKYKIEGQNDLYTGIVSDSGSYTEFKKYNLVTYMQDANLLLQKVYHQPKREINDDYFIYLPKLDNIYNFNIREDERIIFNSKLKEFKTEKNISLGANVKFTMTNQTMYINNGLGMWKIDIHDDISDFKRENMCIDISLTEICIFGQNGERISTGFKLYFSNDDINKFEEIMNNIIK